MAVDADDIGGVVTSSKGPEAGVWVIAETTELPTKFRKIVVTDMPAVTCLPELPKANYRIWVRGYGLVDSKAVTATPGTTLALTAVIAPNAQAAAQYYPANYWYSLLDVPPKSAFPLEKFGPEDRRLNFFINVKRGCGVCHQLGNKATREIEPGLGTFDSPSLAWERRTDVGPSRPADDKHTQQLRARPQTGDVCGLEQPNRRRRGAACAASAAGHRAQLRRHFVGSRYGQIVHP